MGGTGDGAVELQSLFLPPRAVRKAYHPLSVPSTWFPLAAAGLYLPKLHKAWDVATSGELRQGWLMKLRDVPGAQMGDGDKGLAGTSVPANWCVTERLKLLAGQLSD